ncbi:MAG: hypothetical protein IKZ64_00615, partial [Alphaproteobacteria bacterium]|nr:hypothetical protein [Alphaproteobacteria bacterium]
VRIGTDVMYGAAACSTVPSGTPNTAVKFGWSASYTPSAPIQNDKILHTYADKGFYCYCRVTQFNDTKFTDSPWLWLNGGFSKYQNSSDVGDMLNAEIDTLLKTNLEGNKYNERVDSLTHHCREYCATECNMAMEMHASFRTEMYKTVNIPDTGTRCINGYAYTPATEWQESEPIVGAEISNNRTNDHARTDSQGMFRLCNVNGNETFSVLMGPPVIICDLVIDGDNDLESYIDTDSVVSFSLDCSKAAEEISKKNCTDSGGEYKDGKCECDSETLHLKPHDLDKTRCQCEDINKKFDLTEKICKEREPTNASEDNVSLGTDNNNTNTTSTTSGDAEIATSADETTRKAEAAAKIKEAEEAYKKAKETEQSLANRTLGAASTAATGLGLMNAAAAYSEQKADEAAEKDMTAYLETFRCEYGKGQTTKAGNEEITLPGGNDLLTYYTEYKQIADALKNTKKALGMRPGIEEEVVYDRAETGLYQYSSVGKTGGAYTSLANALTDPEGEDAAAWNAQKDESKQKLKAGGIAAAGGVAGGVLGNTAINTDTFKNMFNNSEGE